MFDKVTALIQENKDEYYRSLKYDYEELSLVNQDKPLEEYNLRNLAVDNITKTVALTLSPDPETNQWLLTTSKLDPDRTLDVLKATEAEAIEGINDKKYITPNTLKATTDNRLDNYTKETIITNTIFQYKTETIYSIGQPCYALANNEPIFYYSIKDNNINNNPTEDTEGNYWKQLKFGGDGGNLPTGSIITSTIPITDANLHLADGAKIAYDGVYKEFYDYMQLKLKDKANVNIVGTLTNQNNILSGFSTTSYATLPEIFNPENNTWEIVLKITTGALNDKEIFFGYDNAINFQGIVIGFYNDKKIGMWISSAGKTWDIFNREDYSGTFVFSPNTTYYIKAEYTGSQYILSYSLDGNQWNAEITVNNSTPAFINTNYNNIIGCNFFDNSVSPTLFFRGSIDLNKSYIKINNKYWWKGIIKDISDSNIFCTEEQYNNSITATGNCGKYVLMENEYIRLPTINGWIENITDINNNGVSNEAGLPNITGTFQGTRSGASADYAAPSGAFRRITPGLDTYNTGGGDCYNTEFNASYSNSIYGKSTTVQPKGVKYLIYIVLGTVIKTDIEIDINQIANDINIVAGEASKNSSDILTVNNNINSINTKLNTATTNITALQKSYVVETYNNNGSWYRKYSDGWCEQGAKLPNTGGADIMFNLLVPFKDTNYFIVKNCGSPHTDTPAYRSVSCYNLTTTTAMHTSNTTQVYARYYACGYYK